MSETDTNRLTEQVRERYAGAATAVTSTGSTCCGDPNTAAEGFGARLYGTSEHDELPAGAVAASLGCGNPTAVAELHDGETVLDLGSGGGIDVLLSAHRVGPAGKVYGLDMTEEMLALALANAKEAGVTNVEFLKGSVEDVPLPANIIDVIISNCVINLSTDKATVLAEAYRVLRPDGRVGFFDVVAEDRLTPTERAERGPYTGCIAGALSIGEYREGLLTAGFTEVDITPTHQVADGMHSAMIRAQKATTVPVSWPVSAATGTSACS